MTVYEFEQLKERIENNVGFRYEKSINQSNLFTLNHTRFDIVLLYKKKKIEFEYQCNAIFMKPTEKDCLYALLSDANCHSDSDGDIGNFRCEFGYEKASECIKAFNGCKENYHKLHSLFTDEEIQVLNEFYEDY